MRTFALKAERGFSILELLFAFFISAILIALTFTNLNHSVEQEGPRGMAFALASDIRAARADAQKSGRLVAVCFPSDGKTNSVSRAMAVRKGDQRGHIQRVNRYGSEFNARFFLGQWTPSPETKIQDIVPDAWAASVNDELSIFFRPDGSAFSRDLFPVDGRYPIVIGSVFAGDPSGASGTLTHIRNPNTVWVSSSGTVEVEENKVPVVGTLPGGGSELAAAELNLGSGPSSNAPERISSEFLPKKIDDLTSAYVGQNFISIHPEQKDGEFLEYGLATIELRVRDRDGGPLHYVLRATATSGGEGEFAVPERKGPLRYVYDEERNEYVWYALISWRPPPGAPEDTEYELTAIVTDPDGNTLEITTAAGLLPLVTSLPPSRLVMNTTDDQLYLANLDGSNEIHLTKDGREYFPFFSADGSHVFSFHDLAADSKQLRRRTSSGTTIYDPLCNFNGSSANVKFDPTFTYAAITADNGTVSFPWGRVDSDTDTDDEGNTDTDYTFVDDVTDVDISRIFVVNLMSNDIVNITHNANTGADFQWNVRRRHALYFEDVVPSEFSASEAHAPGPYRVYPGHDDEPKHLQLVGYPSVPVGITAPKEPAYGKVFNPANRNWYLEVSGNDLVVRHRVSGDSATIDSSSSGFENDPDTHWTPAWSAIGDEIAYIKKTSGNPRLITRKILRSDLSGILSSRPVKYDFSAPGLHSAQLSPRGKWVYFLRNESVFRAANVSSAGSPANISSHLGKDVKSYVLSP